MTLSCSSHDEGLAVHSEPNPLFRGGEHTDSSRDELAGVEEEDELAEQPDHEVDIVLPVGHDDVALPFDDMALGRP